MCLIIFSLNAHPGYKLIVAANRDEFYARKTSVAGYWDDQPHVLGGRDLEAGGTWMAINSNGKVSMVTNYRDPNHISASSPSRGHLVSDYVVSVQSPLPYLERVAAKGSLYNGFNLIVGNPNELYYYSNYGNGIAPIAPGLHGLSNHLLDTPWPKVKRGLIRLGEVMEATSINPDDLLDVLYDDRLARDEELPDTGVGLERERALSSIFIKSNGYGSRCSTVLLVDRKDEVQFTERVYNTLDFTFETRTFSFQIHSS